MASGASRHRLLGGLGSSTNVDLQYFDEFLTHEQRHGGWRFQNAASVLARYSTWLNDTLNVTLQLGPKEMSAALKKRQDRIVVEQPNKRQAPLFTLLEEQPPSERGAVETEPPERGADPQTGPPAPRSLQGAAKFSQDASTNKGPHQLIAALKGTVVTLKKKVNNQQRDKVDLRRQVAEAKQATKKEIKKETEKETKKESKKEAEASTSYFSREFKPCYSIIRS
jgi:hypothetical protein